jgi:hypothetical protein
LHKSASPDHRLDCLEEPISRLDGACGIFLRHVPCLPIIANGTQLEEPVEVSAALPRQFSGSDKALVDRGNHTTVLAELNALKKQRRSGSVKGRIILTFRSNLEVNGKLR